MTDKKKEYILEQFNLSEDALNSICHICDNILGTDKYAVWIAKEFKKDESIILSEKLREVIDWAQSTSPNILSMSFVQALEKSHVYHEELKNKVVEATDEKIDRKRIVFRCSDQKHFFYRLLPDDLKREGELMGHCIDTNSIYRERLRKGKIVILSLRDDKNLPHVTCEINLLTGESTQIQGKGNEIPVSRYLDLITEFGTWAAGDSFTDEERQELNKLMQIDKKK